MALAAGTFVGPYQILAPLGAGGMGEVYRAKDTKLDREVAIKVLPPGLAQDPERLARFEREAKVLASLNHPNIATIYGVEERALVMELVEGETLPCPVPVDIAIAYAKQIADALEYAHERGVIHRDLKPANIKVTPEGTIKVLDFGLAKALDERAATTENPANSPTLTMGATAAGVILGTAAYMSPEQAVGKSADRRADIFSYGVVLYEMLAGKRAFAGETAGETLAAVVKSEPDWSALPAATPPHVRKLLEWTLAKDRRQRLQAIGEARITLNRDREGADRQEDSGLSAPSRSRFGWTAAAILGFALAGVSFVHFRETPPEARALSATLLPPDNAEFDFTASYALPAISPDETRIVYGAKGKDGKTQLWLRRLDSPMAQPLPGTEGAATPFWSPDSRWVGFGQGNKLKKIDLQGGPPVTLADLSGDLRGGSWSPQGVIIFGRNARGPILRIAATGGAATPATVAEGDNGSFSQPWFLPDGRHFLYTSSQAGDTPVRVGSIDDPEGPGKVVAQVHSTASYAQGYLLYLRENTLMAQPFDVDRLETMGEAVPVAEGVRAFSNQRLAGFTVTPKGILVYQTAASGGQSRLVWKDRQGKVLSNLGEPAGQISSVALSPDGKRVAASISDHAAPEDLWIYEVPRGIPTRFTLDPAQDRNPVWSPDGSMFYFISDRKSIFDLFRKPSNGGGAEELLLGDLTLKSSSSISPDGKLLLFDRQGEKTRSDLWVLPLSPAGAKPEPRMFLQTQFNERRGEFSPDGQWVAYDSNESGQNEVYAAPFPGPGEKRRISPGGGSYSRWRRDGKEIFYFRPGGQMMAAEVAARNGTLEVGKVQKLFDGIVANRGLTYDVTADGQKFLVVDDGTSSARPLTLLQNWTTLLRK